MIALDLQFGSSSFSDSLTTNQLHLKELFQPKNPSISIQVQGKRDFRRLGTQLESPAAKNSGTRGHWIKAAHFPKISKDPFPGRYANSNVRKTKAKHSNRLR